MAEWTPIAKPSVPRLQRGHPLSQDLLLCVPMYHEVGRTSSARDLSGRDNHGALTGYSADAFVASPFGDAMSFDGTGQYLQGGALPSTAFKQFFTIAAVGRFPASGAPAGCIFAWEDGAPTRAVLAQMSSTGLLQLQTYDGGSNNPILQDNTIDFRDGKFHTWVWQWDGTNFLLWADGKLLQKTAKTAGNMATSGINYRIGRRGSAAEYWSDRLAGVWVWNSCLSYGAVARFSADPFAMLRPRAPLWAAAATVVSPYRAPLIYAQAQPLPW